VGGRSSPRWHDGRSTVTTVGTRTVRVTQAASSSVDSAQLSDRVGVVRGIADLLRGDLTGGVGLALCGRQLGGPGGADRGGVLAIPLRLGLLCAVALRPLTPGREP
jgi:hypothetical protein